MLNTGRMPLNGPYRLFQGRARDVVTVGDCNLAGREMGDAIAEAFEIVRELLK